jgi:hypothetical protein
MIGAFGCHHQPFLRNAPGQRPSRVMSQRCPTRTSGAQESYHGIGRFYALRYWFIAQVAQTCYHPVTNTPGNCISIHYTTSRSQLFTCRHSRTRTLDSPSVAAAKRHWLCLACGTLKNHPRVKDLSEHNLWATCLGWKR